MAEYSEAPSVVTSGIPQADAGGKTLVQYRRMFDDFRSSTETNRREALVDFDYYDGKQLTTAELQVLKDRGQPAITVNRIRVAVNGIMGVTVRSNTDPKAWARTPNDDESASAATDCLRYVHGKAKFKYTKRVSWKDYLCGGNCAALVGIDDDKNVTIQHVRWEEFFYDPRARREDFGDARYMGIAKWMYTEDVQALYPEQFAGLDVASIGTGAPGMIDESFNDRPINQSWVDRRNSRIMVVELYHKYGGIWMKCVFYYGGVLEQGTSPYKIKSKAICPIVAQACYVDRDNNRYGMIRDMRDLQDEINKRRSKLLHIINSSQIQARDPSAIEVDADIARKEAARPDGVLPFGWEKVRTDDMAQGQMLLLTEAKNEMERFGPNPAVLGRQGADTSGRALLARQQAGLIELAIILDQMDEWEERVYEAVWNRIQQYWKAPQYIRVTDDPDTPRFVGINQPQMGMAPAMDPQTGAPMVDPNTMQPQMQQVILGYKNNVAEMDVDITIDVVPETATIMEEQLKSILELMGANQQFASEVPIEAIIELMPIPRKRQLLAKIKAFRAANQAAQAQQQELAMRMQDAELQAKLDETKSKTVLNQSQSELALAEAGESAASAHATAFGAAIDAATALHAAVDNHQAAAAEQNAPQGAGTGGTGA